MSKVPKLRFPGFTGEWGKKEISKVTSYVDYRGKTPTKVDSGIFLVTAKNIKSGFIDYECSREYVSEAEYEKTMSRGLPKIGDVLITTEAPMGNVAQIDRENVALAQRVIKYRGVEGTLVNTFLKYEFLSKRFQDLLTSRATGGTVKGIKGSVLHKLEVNIPILEEQTKIADFLSTLDSRITVQSDKVDSLKEFKKGVMQKIFSQELRFKRADGTEYPEWEEKKLGEVVREGRIALGRGNVISKKVMGNEKPYPVYSSSAQNNGLMGKAATFMFDEELISWSIDGGGKLFHRPKHKFSVTNVSGVLRIKDRGFNCKFLAELLESQRPYMGFDYQSKAHPSVIVDLYNVIEADLEEQTRIADFLSTIDEKIDVESKVLEALQELKKGLLQQMFV